ncbi:MAG: NUDIX hydrolase [Haloarculaceae archaeon]
MRDAVRAGRQVSRLLSRLAADYGRVEVVSRRWECDPAERDAIAGTVSAFDRAGGASALVRNDEGCLLLVRYAGASGWADPGANVEPDEDYETCARRAVGAAVGLDVTITGVAQVHVRHADDWTDRETVAEPTVIFEAELAEGSGTSAELGPGVDAARWCDAPPGDLLYDELAEFFYSNN